MYWRLTKCTDALQNVLAPYKMYWRLTKCNGALQIISIYITWSFLRSINLSPKVSSLSVLRRFLHTDRCRHSSVYRYLSHLAPLFDKNSYRSRRKLKTCDVVINRCYSIRSNLSVRIICWRIDKSSSWMNEWMNEFYNLYPACKTRGSSPRVYSPAVYGN